MALESVRQTIATHNVISPVGSEIVAERQGTYRGEHVRTSQDNSKLSQGIKDTSLTDLTKTNLKTLSTKSMRQGQATTHVATSRIADFYDKVPNAPEQGQLEALVDSFGDVLQPELHHVIVEKEVHAARHRENAREELLESEGEEESQPGTEKEGSTESRREGGNARAEKKRELLAQLQRFDSDVSHQFAALETIRGHYESIGADDDTLLLLDEIRAEYEQTDIARDVRAGFAAAVVANQAAQTLETDPATVRDGYRSMLREQPNLGRLFDGLAKFDLNRQFATVIDTFMTAAGRDLASTGPSTDPTHLHGLLTELSKLKKMQTVFEQGKELIRTSERLMDRKDRGRANPVDLTSRVLNFCAKSTASVNDARLLLGPLSDSAPQSQVVFANGLRSLHSDVPDEVMPSPQARLQQNTSLISLLGQLVDAEEAHYENNVE